MKTTSLGLKIVALITLVNASMAPGFDKVEPRGLYASYETVSDYYAGRGERELASLESSSLKEYLNQVLNSGHIRREGAADELVESCPEDSHTYKRGESCQKVRFLSYDEARRYLFGHVYLREDKHDHFFIEPLYCARRYEKGIGPMKIPNTSVTGLNTEHVFPKSHFKSSRSKHRAPEMKTDIHHLAPSVAHVNSFRGSFHFGEPSTSIDSVDGCEESIRGRHKSSGGRILFSPRDSRKGDVARMMMYFSVRFNVGIADYEEKALRRWHEQDPVSERERKLNDLKFSVQGNRNPFIDYPSLVKRISNF